MKIVGKIFYVLKKDFLTCGWAIAGFYCIYQKRFLMVCLKKTPKGNNTENALLTIEAESSVWK